MGSGNHGSHHEIRHAWCQMCGPARTNCSMLCHIEDGIWTHAEGNPLAGNNGAVGSRSLCAKGNAAMQALYSPSRLLHPLKRIGRKGAGEFVRIGWEEALDEVADTLLAQKERHGAPSLGILSPQYFPVLGSLGRRFLNVHGSPNYLHSGICFAQRMFSRLVTIGGPRYGLANDTAPGQLDKTELLVSWGSNPENSGVNLGGPRARLDALGRGMRLIDIRPAQDALASKAEHWVPIRPGTDAALAMAILQVIIGEGLFDAGFVDRWCDGFGRLAEHIKSHTPEWAAPITGIPAERIRQVARLMGTVRPMAIVIGNGVGDQQADGHWAVACICLIEAVTGNLGVPGGGGAALRMPDPLVALAPIDLLPDRLQPSREDEANGWLPGVSGLARPETPPWFQSFATQESGPTGAYLPSLMGLLGSGSPALRCVIAQSTNPLSATRQPKKVAEALKRLDYYVVMDTHLNPSCAYADIVLPACTHYETSSQIAVRNRADGTWIGINQKVCEPLGESHSDWQLYLDLAVRMGYGDDFWQGDMDACLREQLAPTGISLEELRAAGQGILIPRTDGAQPQEPPYRDYPRMFERLPGGKVQCFNSWIAGRIDATGKAALSGLPVYVGPPEGIAETPGLADEFPLVLSDVHADRFCQHSYFVDVPLLREHRPYPWVKMNPATAARYGIGDGDWVRVESPHGWVRLRAHLTEAIAPDVLMARRGWWQECLELGLPGYSCFDGGSEVNVLYDDDPGHFDPFTSAMPKQTLVKVRKAEALPDTAAPFVPFGAHDAGNPKSAFAEERRRGLVVDRERCINCASCVVACKQWNRIPAGAVGRRWTAEAATGCFPAVRRSFVSLTCRHCDEPECLAACDFDAIAQSEVDGAVLVDPGHCTGCGACVRACSYGVPQMVDGIMDKCDLCREAGIAPGEDPHCVASCPTGALGLVPLRP